MMLAEAAPEEHHLSVQDPPARGGNWIHSGHGHDYIFYDEKEKNLSFSPNLWQGFKTIISNKDAAIQKSYGSATRQKKLKETLKFV
jgi:hypothetical protein